VTRQARFIIPHYPHHIVQRGNKRQSVFLERADYLFYLNELHFYAEKYQVEIICYCIMTNHLHLILTPHNNESLHLLMKTVHTRYALRINKRMNWTGHLWQNRYFSSVIDDCSLEIVARYVEMNPVRANIVENACDYEWSSAPVHCGFRENRFLSENSKWHNQLLQVNDWEEWLRSGESSENIKSIRCSIEQNRPYASNNFIKKLEFDSGRMLQVKGRGRPQKREKTCT
jgi:putative transposase